jgi:hypothetical protein
LRIRIVMTFDFLASARFIICGSSHGSRLANALDDADAKVADLSTPGWSATEKSVELMTEELSEVLEEPWESTTDILYQLLENSSYFAVNPEDWTGSTMCRRH